MFNSRFYNEFIKKMYLYKVGQDYYVLRFNSADDILDSKNAVCLDVKRMKKRIYRRL